MPWKPLCEYCQGTKSVNKWAFVNGPGTWVQEAAAFSAKAGHAVLCLKAPNTRCLCSMHTTIGEIAHNLPPPALHFLSQKWRTLLLFSYYC